MALIIPLRAVFRQTSLMNCWFYAAKTIVYQRCGRLLLEADYLGGTPRQPAWPTGAVAGPFTGRGEPEATWLSSGLPLNHYTEFARRFSFRETPFHPPNWDSQNLEAILLQCGPLHFSGFAGQFGHAVVVC